MKRILLIIATVLLAVSASAQGNFGVIVGMDFNSAKIKDVQMESKAGWNVGITYRLDLPLGFSLQPSLVYSQKSGSFLSENVSSGLDDLFTSSLVQKVGAINLPVSVQWGPDLIVARPFLDVTPYVGYSVMNEVEGTILGISETVKGKNAFDYGLGLGVGLDIWKLQAIVRYNWNFGVLGSLKDFAGVNLDNLKTDNPNFGGISVNLAFFF